jgi:hypothetical protein
MSTCIVPSGLVVSSGVVQGTASAPKLEVTNQCYQRIPDAWRKVTARRSKLLQHRGKGSLERTKCCSKRCWALMNQVRKATESEPIAFAHTRADLPRSTGTEADQQTPDAFVLRAAGQSDSTTATVLIPSHSPSAVVMGTIHII